MNAPRRLPAVLVVDDEVRSLEALRRTLEEDFEMLCASSAEDALEAAQVRMAGFAPDR
jgi:two-component system response regulator HupR/HoxA